MIELYFEFSNPNNLILPENGCNPRIARNNVVLPAPFGPTIPRQSPCCTSKLMLSTAGKLS